MYQSINSLIPLKNMHSLPINTLSSTFSHDTDERRMLFIILFIVILFIVFMLKSVYDISRYTDSENLAINDVENPISNQDQIILISNIKCLINDDCPICIEPFKENDELYQLKCGHIFHTECITEWININNICPTCREVVIDTLN